MSKTNLVFFLTVLGSVAVLVILARSGDPWAMVILAVVWTTAMIIVGAVIVLAVNRQRDAKAQADFVANQKENLANLQAFQRIQNEQNKTLMLQLGQTARLPQPSQNGAGWLIEDGIFDELDS